MNSPLMNVTHELFGLLSRAGQAQRFLQIYEEFVGEPPITRNVEVDETIRTYQLSDGERKGYVLFPLIPGYTTLCRRFCVLAHAFRSHGYEPIILRDDNDLPIRPENTVGAGQPRLSTESCLYRARRYPELFGLDTVSLGEALPDDYKLPTIHTDDPDALRSFTYDGVDIGGCAAASTRKRLKEYTLDLDEGRVRRPFKKFLQGGILIADAVGTLVENYDIELAVVHEANYIQGNVPMQICREAGIGVHTQEKGYHRHSLIFGNATNRHYMPQFASNELTQRAVETELSEQEHERLQSLLDRREEGSVTRVQYTPDNELSVTSDSEYVVGVFSHLLWDGALEPEQALYESLYDWLDDTLRVATEKENVHFVVKTHPAEQIRGTNESTGEWVREHYAPLPDNIDLLPPDTDVNTYALIDDLDAGVVYASTVGLEMALDGTPVLAGGYPPYGGYGISHDPETRAEYVEQLRNIEQLKHDAERQARAHRFAYFLFICKHFDFPYHLDSGGTLEFDHDDIAGADSVYPAIVKQMLADEDVVQPGCLGLM